MRPLITISAGRVTRILLVVVTFLTLAGILTVYIAYVLGHNVLPGTETFFELFDIDREANIPTYYQALTLLACSGLLAIIACHKMRQAGAYLIHWTVLSIIFLGLSIDEATEIHEKTILPIRNAFHTHGFLLYPWVVPAAVFVIIFVLAYLKFLTHLPAKTRNLFILAGALYVLGTLGVEMLGGYVKDLHGHSTFGSSMVSVVEEFLEMLGMVVFIRALMDYIAVNVKDVFISFVDGESGPNG